MFTALYWQAWRILLYLAACNPAAGMLTGFCLNLFQSFNPSSLVSLSPPLSLFSISVGKMGWERYAPLRVAIHRCITATFADAPDAALPDTVDMMTEEQELAARIEDENSVLGLECALAAVHGRPAPTRETR